MLEALGLIEVVGLVGAIEAADTASKAADVKVIGYELTRGSGMVVVKMVGGVSAVKSAVEAASVAAEKITQIISKHVIARPSDELDKIIKVEKEKTDKKLEEKNKICLGIFSCKGFDNYGPFKLIGGINKGKPNEDDTQNLIKFLKNIY